MPKSLTILIADDQEVVHISLLNFIRKEFPTAMVYQSFDGLDAYQKLKELNPNIIICDYDMPRLNGLDLCRRVRTDSTFNKVYFIALTASQDSNLKSEILEAGADDYINKPFKQEEFKYRIRSAERYIYMQEKMEEENILLHKLASELESTINDLKIFGYNLIHARMPNSIIKMHNVAGIATWMAKQLKELDEVQMRDLEIAASMCDCGKISLPDNLVNTPVVLDGQPTDMLMKSVPTVARNVLSKVNRFKEAGEILYRLYENFDGTGFPDGLQSWQIPLSSRIIRVVSDYLDLLIMKKTQQEAIATIKQFSKRYYDHRAVTLLDQFLQLNEAREAGIKERVIKLHELGEGMVLSREIITNSGLKILPKGAILREKTIKSIISHNATDAIVGDIYVEE